jgi:prepilin-type N-terminal cleavage/methylation domain-containing protein
MKPRAVLKNQSGVTLLELLIATIMIGILAVVVSGFYVNRLIDYARTNTLLILQSNTKQALESVQRDIKSAQTIETTNQWPDANGPGGDSYGWHSNNASPSTLVLALPVTDASDTLQYVDSTHAALQTSDVIYYVDSASKSLYRRVVANPICLASQGGSGTVNCSMRTTCPPAAASANCPADGKVIEDVANMTAQYYDTNDASTANVNNIYSVDITLTQSRAKFGKTYTNSLTSRSTLRNKP